MGESKEGATRGFATAVQSGARMVCDPGGGGLAAPGTTGPAISGGRRDPAECLRPQLGAASEPHRARRSGADGASADLVGGAEAGPGGISGEATGAGGRPGR